MKVLERIRKRQSDARASEGHATFVAACMDGLRERVEANDRDWGFAAALDWSMDVRAGTLSFRLADGRRATAPVQVVGTHSPFEGRFLWGWANPSVPEPLKAHALLVRRYGEAYGLEGWAGPHLDCDEHGAWEAAAVALRLSEAAGAYRAPIGLVNMYLTFGAVAITG